MSKRKSQHTDGRYIDLLLTKQRYDLLIYQLLMDLVGGTAAQMIPEKDPVSEIASLPLSYASCEES